MVPCCGEWSSSHFFKLSWIWGDTSCCSGITLVGEFIGSGCSPGSAMCKTTVPSLRLPVSPPRTQQYCGDECSREQTVLGRNLGPVHSRSVFHHVGPIPAVVLGAYKRVLESQVSHKALSHLHTGLSLSPRASVPKKLPNTFRYHGPMHRLADFRESPHCKDGVCLLGKRN